MNWKSIAEEGLPNDRGYELSVQCFVCNPETHWAGIATCDLYGWRDVFPSMDPRDGNITHYCEVELPQDLSVKWPRDWGKVVMAPGFGGPFHLRGYQPNQGPAYTWNCSDGSWYSAIRLATPEEAGDMKPLTMPEDVRG